MANYYFLATLLPPLKVGSPVDLGSKELDMLLRQDLTKSDLEKVTVLRRLIDLENIRAIWQKQPFETGGNFDEFELEEALFSGVGLPTYVVEFMEQYPEKQDRLKHFSTLLHRFFSVESKNSNSFVAEYLTFERQWRLVFVALRAITLKRSVESELQFEDPEDPFVAQLLAEAQKKHFEPPRPFEELKPLYEARKKAPLDLYQALSIWRFDYLEEQIEWENFSIERILGYIAQLEICEKWLELDKRKGLEIAEEMMEVV